VAAGTIAAPDPFGLPVSTTHVPSSGPIMPCGSTISSAREWDEMEPHALPYHRIPLQCDGAA
jgi:phosphate/sulfate permease